ncbi:two-partner secretion domain-containing protein, partial [Thiomicrospira microaerophila]|uniref:two-partner secretion domain-containing protein n=1 Tax=Thiomicrospira microaerophila TaxID=406020 RepID=UPI0005C8BC61
MHNKNSKIKRASLNHTYRLVWSDAKQMYIAVAEIAPGKGKRKGGIVGAIAALMMGFGGIAHALDPGTLPEGANIVHGQAQIQQHNNVMTIHQTSDKLITNWNSFNIGKDATVNFQQPNSNSAALNRVMDNNPSQIHGRLNANGNVYLVNPSGILFGKTAQVDVGGLIASTLEISDQDFLDNKLDFKNLGFSEGDIKNLGHIRANGGVVALIANRVSNQGTIEANNGNVALAAGDHVTLDFNGDGLMTVTVEQGVLDALAENGGLIQADGGFVIMTTQARQDIYRNLVNNDGLIQAQTLSSKSGRIMLMGGMTQGQVTASGKLDASAPNGGDGGFIETSAAKVDIQPGLVVTTKAETGKTGEWLIDPTDIEIVAGTGGDFDSNASSSTQIGADTLVANLANNNITVQTPSADTGAQLGDITVSADIVWNANTTLTLDAINHIYVKAKIENQNTTGGGVYFNAANNHFAVGFDNNGKVVIHNAEQLQWMNTALSGKYQLGSDIVLTAPAEGESNWTPIGDSSSLFRGIFDGKNHTIDGLTMNSTGNYQGFFGINFTHSVIKNLGLTNVDINSTGWYIGGLIGENRGTLSHVYVTGKVTGETSDFIGGVVGVNGGGNIDNAFSSATVKGRDSVGGLIGRNLINVMGVTSSLTISNTFFTGSVEGRTNVGGLIGENSMSANVMMMGNANANLSIEDSYATGKVKGQDDVGGLIGKNSISASGGTAKSTLTITNTYSTASVEGATNTGGLIGSNTVTRTNNGQATITTTDSFWDTQTSGLAGADDGVGNQNATTSGVQGKTTSEMQSVITAVYDKWDFDTVWEMDGDYPVFQVQTVIEPCDVTSGLPSCGRVINGAGTIGDIDGNNLTINQTASKLIIDWKQFDIAAGNTVHFEQKENGVAQTSWVALNRVTENNPSQILGKLTADGRVYLVNPSGILFGANAQVDVAGLVASNAQINQADFNNGTLTFADPTGGYISVQGTTENWSLGEGGLTLVAHSDASNRFVVDEAAPDDTSSGISATALLNRLEDSQVVLRVLNSNGSFENSAMDINQDIVWSANNALRLHSDHRINVNALIANNSDDGGVYIQSVNNNNSLLFGENGIVEVYNLHQLQRINQTLKGKFRLGQDIDATETANWNNNQGWMPIGDNGDRFQGTFDGQGYTLSNLFINRPDTYNVGLFGVVSNSGAEIKNLGLVNVDITGLEGVGAITGRNLASSQIQNVFSTGVVKGTWTLGGLVGLNEGTISKAYSNARVDGVENTIGGLVGSNSDTGVISNVYSSGAVSGGGFIGGLLGTNAGVISSAYTTASVSSPDPKYVGGLVGISNGTINHSFWDIGATGLTTSAGGEGKTASEMRTSTTFTNAGWSTEVWSFTEAGQGAAVEGYEFGGGLPYLTALTRKEDQDNPITLFAGGWGDADDKGAYTITNWNQLQNINLVVGEGFDFALSNDLTTSTDGYAEQVKNGDTLANNGAGWNPIGEFSNRFSGSFDGQGNTLSNLTINRSSENNIGLFGFVENATISNIGLDGGSINGNGQTGALIGNAQNNTQVIQTYSTLNVEGAGFTGGLVGFLANSTIVNSYATGDVTASGNSIGGLVGYLEDSTITNSYAAGDVVAGHGNFWVMPSYAGGLVGYSFTDYKDIELTNVYATGKVTGSGSFIGGLIGVIDGSSVRAESATALVTNAYASGAVSGATVDSSDPDTLGGLIGGVLDGNKFALDVTKSFWDTQTSGQTTSAGGEGKTIAQMKDALTFTGWDTDIWSFPAAGRGAEIEGYEWGEGGLPYLTHVTRVEDLEGGGAPIILFAGGWGGLTDGDADGSAYTITNWNQLQNINLVLDKGFDFLLSNNLTTETTGYAEQVKNGDTLANNGTGWMPIGNLSTRFTGVFDGAHHTIDGLRIHSTTASIFQGFFGATASVSEIKNLGLTNVDIETPSLHVGGLVGTNLSALSDVYVTGSVTGDRLVGGLVGSNTATITNAYAAGSVTATGNVAGGLIGQNSGFYGSTSISNTYFAGDVKGQNNVGGLIGENSSSPMMGEVTLNITNAYATGSVEGSSRVGGLIGANTAEAFISNSKATINITHTYATASVEANDVDYPGGLVGANTVTQQSGGEATITITDSFWDRDTSDVSGADEGVGNQDAATSGVRGKTTAEMKGASTFTGWDTNIWSFPAAGRGAEIEGYEWGEGGLPYLTHVTRVEDRDGGGAPIILFAGGWGGLTDGDADGSAYTIVNWNQLQNINLVVGEGFDFALSNDLTTETDGYAEQVKNGDTLANNGTGWMPLGNDANRFTGVFDGANHLIDGLIIDRSAGRQGLFGVIENVSTVKNLGLTNVDISSTSSRVGGLAGDNRGSVSNVYVTGDITGGFTTGGLIGQNRGTLNDVHVIGNVKAGGSVGGLVGDNRGSIETAYVVGSVKGDDSNVGGLIGYNNIQNVDQVTINKTYFSGSVEGQFYVGGLIGQNYVTRTLSISNAYAIGSVKGNSSVGGLIGSNYVEADGSDATLTISSTYSASSVTGSSGVGGLVGRNTIDQNDGEAAIHINHSFWDTSSTGQTTSAGGGTGKKTPEMKDASTFTTELGSDSWDTNIWSFPAAGRGAEIEGYEYGDGGLPYLTNITRVQDQGNPVILFEGGWGDADDKGAYTITNWNQLQNINLVLDKNFDFLLSNNLNSETDGYAEQASVTANEGTGWMPIGNDANRFTGVFDGGHHTIDGLIINRSSHNQGLFGATATFDPLMQIWGSEIKNLGLTNVDINVAGHRVGALVGENRSTVSNVYVTGSVKGGDFVGGLIGQNTLDFERNGADALSISNGYSTASVTGNDHVGGLIGANSVRARSKGGSATINITNTNAAASVTGAVTAGGLVGNNLIFGDSGTETINITGSFWNTQTAGADVTRGVASGDADPAGVVGKTTTELQTLSTFTDAGWDISNVGGEQSVWRIYEGYTAPMLRSFLTPLTLEAAGSLSKTYDATTDIDASELALSWKQDGQVVTPDGALLRLAKGSPAFVLASKNAGNQTLLSQHYSTQTGFDIIADLSVNVEVNKANLAVMGLGAEDRVYDGTTDAPIIGQAMVKALGKDSVTLAGDVKGTFVDKNVGENKAVTLSGLTLTGEDAGNYTLVLPSNFVASISKADLTISGLSVADRVYDGSRIATIVIDGVQYAGLVGKDDVKISATGEFADKNVGENKEVTISSTYSGADVGNYKITNQTTTTANITAKELVIKGLTAKNRTYDGSRVATIVIDGVEYAGLVENDDVSISATGEFDNKNVGEDKEVTITSTYTGADLNNYSIVDQTTTTATITAKELIISGLTAEGKVYDGNRIATIVIDGVQYAGLVGKDEIKITATGEFDNKNIGENKTVSITSEYSGADVGNYKIVDQTETSANITAKELVIKGLTAENRTYDGSRVATIVIDGVEYAGLVKDDDVS